MQSHSLRQSKFNRSLRSNRRVLPRRTLLRGAGGVALGLPLLDAMFAPGQSFAQPSLARRFIVFYSPGGTLLDSWRPNGSPDAYTLSPMLSPLEAFKDKLTFIDGTDLSITSIGAGHPHSRGMAGVLTGRELAAGDFETNGGNASFATGPSLDQVLGQTLSEGRRFKSLEFSAGWSTGITQGGEPHPANTITYEGDQKPIPPATNPVNAFNRLFAESSTEADAQARLAYDLSILDTVKTEYETLLPQLGASDRAKLDQYLNLVREAEQGLGASVSDSCAPPDIDRDPEVYEDGLVEEGVGITTGSGVPKKGDVMTSLLTAAIGCDLTRVATMQWGDSEAEFQLNFLSDSAGNPLVETHHGYQHDRGFQPEALEIVHNWYAKNFATLLERLDSMQEGDGTVLDNSLVLWVTELQQPETHAQDNMPFVLAGGKNISPNFATGRWLQVEAQPHNNLLSSIQGYFGEPDPKFGHPEFVTGPLAGL